MMASLMDLLNITVPKPDISEIVPQDGDVYYMKLHKDSKEYSSYQAINRPSSRSSSCEMVPPGGSTSVDEMERFSGSSDEEEAGEGSDSSSDDDFEVANYQTL